MAIYDVVVSGKIRADDGDGVSGANVKLQRTAAALNGAQEGDAVTTDSNGTWTFTVEGSDYSQDYDYDINISKDGSERWIPWSDEIALKTVDTTSLKIRGANGAVAPLYFFADGADDAGDNWRIQASASDTLAIGSDKASRGSIVDVLTITNNATASSTATVFAGTLEAKSLTAKGIEGGDGAIFIMADEGDDAGDEWQIIQEAGTNTLDFKNDIASAGTYVSHFQIMRNATIASSSVVIPGILDVNGAVDWNVTDVQIDSTGDIDIETSYNTASAIYVHASGGTSSTIGVHSETGTAATAINLVSTVGGVRLGAGLDAASAILLHANAGTSETIKIHSDQGTSVTEGAESVTILSDAGGVGIRSTANLANAVNITVDGGTSSTMTLFNDQGTAVSEGAASIQLLSDVGGVGIKSGLDGAGAILLTADGGTSETIKIHSDQGTGAGSIELASDAGGITLTADDDIILATNNKLYLNETADGNATTGIVINQGAADDSIISLKSSDVAHPFTAVVEADTFGLIRKGSGTQGGLRTRAFTEGNQFAHTTLGYVGGTPSTAHSTAGWSMIAEDAYHTNGSTGSQAAPTNSNLWGVVSAGAAMKMIVDAEGDIFYDGAAAAFDGEDDISLLRAVQKVVAPDQVISQEFDKFLNANEDDLIRLGILGASRTPDDEGHYGLVCLTKLTQLLTGAAVQLYGQLIERDKRIEALETKMLAIGG
jgi:hypothetical protein